MSDKRNESTVERIGSRQVPPSYASGRHELDDAVVLGRYTVGDLKDAIWWLFYGRRPWPLDDRYEGVNGHGLWLKGIVEELGQGKGLAATEPRHAESLVRCIQNVQESIDRDRDRRAQAEAKERAEYERLHAKYGGNDAA